MCPQLYFNPGSVRVTLDLLEKPPHYDDVPAGVQQNSLRAATGLLHDVFASHSITFFFAAGTSVLVRPGWSFFFSPQVSPNPW